jgi:hypothetical protein
MKKTIILSLFLSSVITQAQLHFSDNVTNNIGIHFEPTSSFRENSFNSTFYFEHISHFGYLKPSIQILPELEDGYIDFALNAGLTMFNGIFEKQRIYAGVRLGLIKRGTITYPLAGLEAGINFKLGNSFIIGARTSMDWREDFKYTFGDPSVQFNGALTLAKEL